MGNLVPADEDWTALDRLSGVWELWLSDPPAEAVAHLPKMAGLRTLSVHNFWTARELDALPLPRLVSLFLCGGPERLDWLAGLDRLSSLSLCGSGRFGLAPVAGLERLQYLFLFNCRISDDFPLSQVPDLKAVYADAQLLDAVEAASPDHTFALNP